MNQRRIKIREGTGPGCIKKALWERPVSIAGRIWPAIVDAALPQSFILPLRSVDFGNMENLAGPTQSPKP